MYVCHARAVWKDEKWAEGGANFMITQIAMQPLAIITEIALLPEICARVSLASTLPRTAALVRCHLWTTLLVHVCCWRVIYVKFMCLYLISIHPDENICTTQKNNCSAFASCHDHVGTFTCTCNSGFTGDGFVCQGLVSFLLKFKMYIIFCLHCRVILDINECDNNNGGCSAGLICFNTVGSFICSNCPPGFMSDGTKCAGMKTVKEKWMWSGCKWRGRKFLG